MVYQTELISEEESAALRARYAPGLLYAAKADINGVVKPSAPQKFTIGIAAQGSELRFYANDKLLASTEDTIFTTGGYGLLASSAGYGPLTVSFSNFTLSEIY